MRLFITADTHILSRWKCKCAARLEALWKKHLPDALIIAGDISHSNDAADAFKAFRKIVGDTIPIAACLGNHDFWASNRAKRKCLNPEDIFARYWVPIAEQFGIILLDQANADFADCTVVGAYGHYDYGFASPGLQLANTLVDETAYSSGQSPIESDSWNDKKLLPCARGDIAEAQRQADGMNERLALAAARKLPIVAVTHTAPFDALIGYPAESTNPDSFFRAYSGSTRTGAALTTHADKIAFVACGHTHRRIEPTQIPLENGRSIYAGNVGSDYGHPEGIIFDTTTLAAARA